MRGRMTGNTLSFEKRLWDIDEVDMKGVLRPGLYDVGGVEKRHTQKAKFIENGANACGSAGKNKKR